MARSGESAGRVHRAYAWVGDRQIHYRRTGPAGARSPLLLLQPPPPMGGPAEDFMVEVGRDRSVIAPDLPGTGMSDRLEGPADTAGKARALLELVAELGLGIVDVMGVGEGADVAVAMARVKPEIVRKVIVVSGTAAPSADAHPTLVLDPPAFPPDQADRHAVALRRFLDG